MLHYVLTAEYKRNIHSQGYLWVSREISNTMKLFFGENTISRKLLSFVCPLTEFLRVF